MDRDPFFTTVSSKRAKRWGADRQTSRSKKNLKPRPGKGHNQDEMDSDNDIGSLLEDETMNRLFNNDDEPDKDDTVVEESASEKRLRMAKEIIQQIEEEEREREIEGDMLTDAVSHRLREEVDRQKGVLRRLLAQKLQGKVPSSKLTVTLKGHRLPVTSAVISADTRYVVTGSKDGVIIKWLRQGIVNHITISFVACIKKFTKSLLLKVDQEKNKQKNTLNFEVYYVLNLFVASSFHILQRVCHIITSLH